MKKLSVYFRLGLVVALFFLTFAGSSSDLEEHRKSFYRSHHPLPELSGFEGIRFGTTLDEFRQLTGETPGLGFPGNATVDWGRKGGRRMKVYMKEKGYAGAIQGDYFLFKLDSRDHGTVLGNAFLTPGDHRLHHLAIFSPTNCIPTWE